jgi:hypothetical protein
MAGVEEREPVRTDEALGARAGDGLGPRGYLALLAPSLVAMSLILSAFAGASAHPLTVARPLVAAFAIGLVVSGISFAIIRRPVAAAAVAALVIIALSGTSGLLIDLILALLWAIRIRWRVIHRRPAPVLSLGVVMGGAWVFLIAGMVTAALAHGYDPRDWTDPDRRASSGRLPSIYVVLVDGYPNGGTLREIYDVDNEPFLSSLEALGFVVDRDSRSTHFATELTVLGMLSGGTHVTESELFGADGVAASREVRRELRSTPGAAALRGAGYELVTLASPVGAVTLDDWDRVASNGHVSDFEIAILGESLVGPLLGDMIMDDLRSRLNDELRDLAGLADPSVQRVVLVHLMAPHPPFLWDQEGERTKTPACWPQSCHLFVSAAEYLGLPLDVYVRQMRAQVAHLNGLVEASISSVVERDPTGIVVVMSDHGSRYSIADHEENYRNLFAIRSSAESGLGNPSTLDDLFIDLIALAELTPAK